MTCARCVVRRRADGKNWCALCLETFEFGRQKERADVVVWLHERKSYSDSADRIARGEHERGERIPNEQRLSWRMRPNSRRTRREGVLLLELPRR